MDIERDEQDAEIDPDIDPELQYRPNPMIASDEDGIDPDMAYPDGFLEALNDQLEE